MPVCSSSTLCSSRPDLWPPRTAPAKAPHLTHSPRQIAQFCSSTHTPARTHPLDTPPSSQRRSASLMVSPTPLSSNVARKIERSRRVSAKGATRPGRRANQPAPPSRGFVWPRGAPYGFRARPWRPLPHPLPRGRLRSGDSSRSGERLASAPARRAAGGVGEPALSPRRPDELRVALRAHGLTAPPPRSERPPTSSRAGSKNTTKPHKNHKKHQKNIKITRS